MILTKKLLQALEESLWIRVTREQRAILFLWYGSEPDKCRRWTEEDIIHGIKEVLRYYPDHRPKLIPDFLRESDPNDLHF